MAIRVSMRVPDLTGLGRKINAAIVTAAKRTVEQLPERITDELRAGRKPDGTAQPDLEQGYRDQKVAAGFPATSGVRTGRLSDPKGWITEQLTTDAIAAFRVSPPRDRADVVRWLQANPKRWEFVDVPDAWIDELRASVKRALDGVGRGG